MELVRATQMDTTTKPGHVASRPKINTLMTEGAGKGWKGATTVTLHLVEQMNGICTVVS